MQLIIAEKPSVAHEIAKIVKAATRKNGYILGKNHLVSWCIGHLVELVQPDTYNPSFKKWHMSSLPIIPDPFQWAVSERTKNQYNILKDLMLRPDITEIICATDAGREGELIFRLVYNQSGCQTPFKRLWISSLEEKSIRDGLASLKDGSEYDNLYYAAACRQQADWLMGINLSRLYSLTYNLPLSVGRVQTPTVNLIVQRQAEIDRFVPQTYYNVIADLGTFKAQCRIEDTEMAETLVARCKGKSAHVTEVVKSKEKKNPQALYDLTTLQRDANRLLGYSAQKTLDLMQALYDKKLVTYPRTDSRYITADMADSTKALINELLIKDIFDDITSKTYKVQAITISRIVNDKKVTDHHAIIPTASLSKDIYESLPAGEKHIVTLILYRLLTAPYSAHTFAATKATLDIEGQDFEAKGKEIINMGYKAVEREMRKALAGNKTTAEEKEEKEVILPPLAKGDTFTVVDITAEAKKTQPPKAYTEDTLLSAMETAGKYIEDEELKEAMKDSGLGTPATRADIIENIIRKGYIAREKKKLFPTEKAKNFMALVTEKIKQPELTAEWEKKLAEVQRGEMSSEAFMEGISGFLRSFIAEVKAGSSDKGSVGVCPRCGKYVMAYPKAYSCQSSRDGCGFVVWRTQMGKTINEDQVKKLLEQKKTDLIKGFRSKRGNEFNACITLKEDGTTGLEFEKK